MAHIGAVPAPQLVRWLDPHQFHVITPHAAQRKDISAR